MTSPRFLLLILPVALGLVQPATAKQRAFAQVDSDGDGFIDPTEFAGNAKGRAWKTAMLNFAKRDTNEDNLLSLAEYDPSKSSGGGLYGNQGEQEALPLKWTTGINLTWEDGVVSKAERKSFNALLKKAKPTQREELKAYWDELQAAVLEAGPQGAVEAIANVWAQTDPAGAAAWVQSLPGNDAAREELLQGIISGWAQSDPAAAAEWIAGEGSRPPEGGRPPRGNRLGKP